MLINGFLANIIYLDHNDRYFPPAPFAKTAKFPVIVSPLICKYGLTVNPFFSII